MTVVTRTPKRRKPLSLPFARDRAVHPAEQHRCVSSRFCRRGLSLLCVLPPPPPRGHWGAPPCLSKLDYKTTLQSLSLILDDDTCSGQYLTNLGFSVKVVIHSNNTSPWPRPVILPTVHWDVAQGRVDLLPSEEFCHKKTRRTSLKALDTVSCQRDLVRKVFIGFLSDARHQRWLHKVKQKR